MIDLDNSTRLGEMLASEEQKKRFSEAFTRAWNHFMPLEDRTLIVLKGHLLIEEQLRKMVDDKLLKPKEIQRFSFSQYLSLARAMYELPEEAPWVWTAISKLNQLRNSIAHELEPGDIEKRIEAFRESVPRENERMPEHSIKDCITRTYLSCTWFTVITNCT